MLCLCAKRETNRPRRRRSPCKLSPTHDVGVFLPPPPPQQHGPSWGEIPSFPVSAPETAQRHVLTGGSDAPVPGAEGLRIAGTRLV